MDTILKRICKLLESDDIELQCAAARVLGEIRPRSPEVRARIAARLSSPNLTVKHYILSALERNPGKEMLPHLFPLLKEGGKIQERARAIIASTGPFAVSEARKLYAEADTEFKTMLTRILGMIGNQEACTFLILSIRGAGLERCKNICLALREAIARMSRDQKRSLAKKINALLASPGTKTRPEEVAAGVILLGYIGDNAAIGKLLKYAAPGQPRLVRKQALIALSRMDIPAKSVRAVAEAVAPMLDEDDYPNIVQNALTLLKRTGIPAGLLRKMKENIKNKRPSVRSFIISRMGKLVASEQNIEMLIEHLNSPDFQDRRAAQDALSKIPAACPRIIKELDEARDYEVTMRLISILKALRDCLGDRDKRHLLSRLEKLRAADDERSTVYATALKAAAPDFLAQKLLNRAKRLKASGKFRQQESILRILTRHSLATDDVKYELAVASLRNGTNDLSPLRRRNDEALKLIAELMKKEEFPLSKRLKAEKALRPEEIFYVGFHFSENLFEQRAFGISLLRYLAKKSPRSKCGRSAKEKLNLAGVKA